MPSILKAGQDTGNNGGAYPPIDTQDIAQDPPRIKLSAQETQCLKWIALGKTSWETSRIMGISEATVIFHVANLMRKLDAVSRSHAVAIAFRSGLLT